MEHINRMYPYSEHPNYSFDMQRNALCTW